MSSPAGSKPRIDSLAGCIQDQQSLSMPCREWLYKHLEERGFSSGFRQWMGSNLVADKGQFSWTFDIKCAKELYQSYQDNEYWDLVQSPPAGVQLNIVRAAQSDRSASVVSQHLKQGHYII